jgi:predicted HicB family RNase H-like nuclease
MVNPEKEPRTTGVVRIEKAKKTIAEDAAHQSRMTTKEWVEKAINSQVLLDAMGRKRPKP